MWRRLKVGRSARSQDNDPLDPFPSITLPIEETTRQSTRSSALPKDIPRHHSLPEPTLKAATSGDVPSHRSSVFANPNNGLSSQHQRQRSQDRRNDPLGLSILCTPPDRTVDILFIHGLGGTSLRTWCWDRDLDFFWPQLWLARDLPTARVLTYGYNTNFSSKKEQASSTIGDFATDLLFRMKYGENTPERMGQVPIVVVAHSMGGLVFKKAFSQGYLNPEYKEIVAMIKAVLFMATPHRGTDLADTLNKLLSSSLFGHSPKEYITQLSRRSPTIDELNETFRHHASKLSIFSFYETLTTPVGPSSVLILDKATSITGYPNETPTPLIANHHTVCKFASPEDPNYVAVIGAIRSVAGSPSLPLTSYSDIDSDGPIPEEDVQTLSDLLGITGPPEEDLVSSRLVRKHGTCHRFLQHEEVDEWIRSNSRKLLWTHGPPGNGKSTTSSFVIEHLLSDGHNCSYFFFKYRQRNKCTTGDMLRSLAYQTALQLPAFRHGLIELAKSGVRLAKVNSSIVWEKVFSRIFVPINTKRQFHWVIDGIDESESSKQVVEFLSRIADFESTVMVLALSRPLANIAQAFQLARKKVPVLEMPLPDNSEDIRLTVAEEVDYLLSEDDFKQEAVNEIAARSHGNFLWASLVTKQVVKCHRKDQVKQVLDSTPDGMDQLYDRMLDAIVALELDDDKALAKILLTWAMHAQRPVTVEQLAEIYPKELNYIMDITHTISHVCGQFVVVDSLRRITLVHHSAREYLKRSKKRWPFNLNVELANEEIFGKCLITLCDKGLRRKINMLSLPRFLPYAATSWAAHLGACSSDSDRVLDALIRFFSGPFPLAWIQYLAKTTHLGDLFGVSRQLTSYLRKRRKGNDERSPLLHRLTDLALIETWALDLMKLPPKFGRHLTEAPELIYKCIPALSPTASIIHQRFRSNPAATLSVSGVSNQEWDDCLARVSSGSGRALRLASSPSHLAVASDVPKGSLTIWDTDLFQEQQTFVLDEHIWELAFNVSGSLLACYSFSKTTIWKTVDWSLELSVENPRQERAIEISFDGNHTLLMVSEQRRVYKITIGKAANVWDQLDPVLLEEPGVPPGDNKVVWHPSGAEVVGIYGQIFKWSPLEDTYEEVTVDPSESRDATPHGILCSPSGRVFITMDVAGCIKIWDYASMSLLYKLKSEDRINQIDFSHDSLRFYDLRGSYCNIWEPNCLLRIADLSSAEGMVSDTDSVADSFWSDTADTLMTTISYPTSEAYSESKPAVTIISPGNTSSELLAYATADGSIYVYDMISDKRHQIAKAMFKMAVVGLVWSPDDEQLAYFLSNGGVAIMSVTISKSAQVSVSSGVLYTEKKAPTDRGRTLQIEFASDGKQLLVVGSRKAQVLSVQENEVRVVLESEIQEPTSRRWKQHPTQPGNLLHFTDDQVQVFSWSDLQDYSLSFPLSLHHALPLSTAPATIDAILDSHNSDLMLLRTKQMHMNRPRYGFLVLTTPNLNSAPIRALTVDAAFIPNLSLPLGILSGGELVFLDKHLWVCTTNKSSLLATVETTEKQELDVTRHFFLPRNWVTDGGLNLCRLLGDGTLLCPTKGEVAVLKGIAN
ncbi:hypothetical protein B0T21DRAFT_353139 [Apiosordaria backusii]|uniref:GPI inositol-deacylase n=1 Tax=Apiosordaria backusii TaxID=314023 RepID=A0AA39ZYC0_9PEZI|nr:hypothetical protein B0T21DRAFT_353139 [Apiosordaria backusii]